jgi:Na+-transporting NADH:ubiquinone oxidoreductase subunit NqrD
MNQKEQNKRFLKIFFDGLYFENPVFGLFLGLTVAILVSTTIQKAYAMGILMLLNLLIIETLLSLFRKHLSLFSSRILAVFFSAALATIEGMFLVAFLPEIGVLGFAGNDDAVLITVVPFLATSSLILAKGEKALSLDPLAAFMDAFGSGIGYLASLVILAFFREFLGTGKFTYIDDQRVKEIVVFSSPFGILTTPFGGFLFTGIFSAIHSAVVSLIARKKEQSLLRKEAH